MACEGESNETTTPLISPLYKKRGRNWGGKSLCVNEITTTTSIIYSKFYDYYNNLLFVHIIAYSKFKTLSSVPSSQPLLMQWQMQALGLHGNKRFWYRVVTVNLK